jgi:hypothetical protein
MIIPHVPADRLGPDWPHAGGLTAGEALAARQRYGANDIVEAVGHPWVQFFSRLEWLLIGLVGALMAILVTAGYLRSFETGDVDHERAMALGVLTLSSATLTGIEKLPRRF